MSRFRCAARVTLWLAAVQMIPSNAEMRFQFREPATTGYRIERPGAANPIPTQQWLTAWSRDGRGNRVELGSRVVLEVAPGTSVELVLTNSLLRLDRCIRSNLFILQATNALAAAEEAARLATLPGVRISHPVRRRRAGLHGHYSPAPNDPYFPLEWHLENRNTNNGVRLGPDLNARGAWAVTRGKGVLIGISDNGIEVNHPDLAANASAPDHYNFASSIADGSPVASDQAHGTAVAGLAIAVDGNRRGVSGVAPGARFASWIVFDSTDSLTSEEAVMDMFQYHSNVVSVQNHSWGNIDITQLPISELESQGLNNAVQNGRGGLGVVVVRAAGNERQALNDANDDGYDQGFGVITVGAVRVNGRATSFSTPGANVLLAAFSGDPGATTPGGVASNYVNLVTTDRQGRLGYNTIIASDDRADYGYGATGFAGTSGAAPEVVGIAALILSVNPALSYRDVQQILIFAAQQSDPADASVQLNGAGFAVSHNVGFGVPNAASAVALASRWPNRPPAILVSVSNTNVASIPDDGLRVLITGTNLPANLQSIPAFPSDGPQPDDPTSTVPLVDEALGLVPISADLHGKAALMMKGGNSNAQKVLYAAAAGAAFAVVWDNLGGDLREFMQGADFHLSPIPSIMISQNDGLALHGYLSQQPEVRAQLRLSTAQFTLTVTNTLICEHVSLRVQFNHPRRADVRLTLVSPAGTRSVLHHFNQDTTSSLGDWTFYSNQHYFESSAGEWRVAVGDERPGQTGQVMGMTLTIEGVPIEDSDHDGLDDGWELSHFGTLAFGPNDDNDGDGLDNMREQIMGTDPTVPDRPLNLDLSLWNNRTARLSWPGMSNVTYEVQSTADLSGPFTSVTNVPGVFPESEWLAPLTNSMTGFLRLLVRPKP